MDAFVLTSTHGGINLLVGNGPGAIGEHEPVDMSIFSDTSEMTVYRESVQITLDHVRNHPLTWFKLIPVKFLNLWGGDAGWTNFAYAVNLVVFQERFRDGLPLLRWFTQRYWEVVVLMAAAGVLTRPWRYWFSFPANLFPVLIVYWTVFHMAFFGMGRFHSQVIPVVVILAVHLLSHERDWLACARPFQNRTKPPS